MSKRPKDFLATIAILMSAPTTAFAQLPNPTYGWNLGNTMESTCGVGCWAPAPTQALINAVGKAGFNTIRVPCAWDTHANQTTYQIDPAYMAQVKQVVDWCYSRGLYVVINDHWDDGGTGNNSFGLFDRNSSTLVDTDSARALTGGAAYHPPQATPSAPAGLTARVAEP